MITKEFQNKFPI